MAYTREQQASARAQVRPILWARLAVEHTKKTCSIVLLFPILALGLIVITGTFKLNDPGASDYLLRNDLRTQLDDARSAALQQFKYTVSDDQNRERTNRDTMFIFSLMLRGRISEDGQVGIPDDTSDQAFNVFSPKSFALLKKAEDFVINHPDYQKYCLYDPDARDCSGNIPTCAPIISLTNSPFLYGESSNRTKKICGRKKTNQPVSKQAFQSFTDSLFKTNENDKKSLDPQFSFLLGKGFNETDKQSWIMQSRIAIGTPFKGYKIDEQSTEQEEAYNKWARGRSDQVSKLTTSKIDLFLISSSLANAAFGDIAIRDMAFSLAAMILVFVVLWVHTGSYFLANTAMTQVFLAFPLAFVFYHFIFRQLYFAALQILAIFLLLGIGADDVFVFTDAWKQAVVVLGEDCDLITRMSWTYRRSVKAMTVTSITTAAAFFVTATSSIMPIGTLGVWAGLLIILQFLLVITVYPCAIIIWERFWSKRLFIRGFRPPREGEEAELKRPVWHRFIPSKWRPALNESPTEYRRIERFFRGPWMNFVHKGRYFLIILAVALAGTAIYLTTRLSALQEVEAFLPETHPISRAQEAQVDAFPRSEADLQLRVRLTWGINQVDRSGTSKFEPDNPGKVILDKNFDFRKKEVQQRIFEACSTFRKEKELLFQGPVIEPVDCWIEDYKSWRSQVLKKKEFETYSDGKKQVDELIRFGNFENPGTKSQPYLNYLTEQNIAFSEEKDRVVFTEIRLVSNVERITPQDIMWETYNKWQSAVDKFNKESPNGANKMIATGGFSWMWQITQRALVRAMFIGIAVMLGVSVLILSLATMNWAIAILTTLVIAGVVATLLGVIYLIGWELGITESVGVVISVGYSFDGAAHIATAYIESKSETRYDKTRDAMTDLGISILFGAITTLLAGTMLLPAVITFFVKFAILITITILSSMLWALVFLPAILLTVGPTGSFGSLGFLIRPFKTCVSERRVKQLEESESDDLDLEAGAREHAAEQAALTEAQAGVSQEQPTNQGQMTETS